MEKLDNTDPQLAQTINHAERIFQTDFNVKKNKYFRNHKYPNTLRNLNTLFIRN